jgi:hypothetical protein
MIERITLAGLAFGCHVYNTLGGDVDGGYTSFVRQANAKPDLTNKQQCIWLLEWLNRWGCRQFKKADYDLAANEISAWYTAFGGSLVPKDKDILSLTDAEFGNVERVYNGLVSRTASVKETRGRRMNVRFGPVGTAKILFALRPNALIPWDNPIFNYFSLDGSAHSYTVYLRKAKKWLNELGEDCKKNGFELAELPRKVGRPGSPLAKLIDEYLWVTVAKRWKAPSIAVLEQWVSWS